MQCGSLDNDASVTWKVNGTDVKAQRREEGPRLILINVDMGNNGLYSCFQNPDGQRRDQITLRIGCKSELSLLCPNQVRPKRKSSTICLILRYNKSQYDRNFSVHNYKAASLSNKRTEFFTTTTTYSI